MSEETQEKLKQVLQVLKMISEDTSVPRNIRRAANESIDAIETDKVDSAAVKASNAISILDEISQDPNCPLHARTRIWNAVSILETISD
ncbi:UPF0147 family protein [Candidatus Borrarchaeum sp.]|jgi:uncharacterized protein (UPF0147 family)|uniref:UPF0147 family protein n=1 Tax=Candidatus Borrarchaeum sp. TaxID=2846742 RepID=UPI00257A8D76|nr:UPF0147 family protein [Candidatus Borrarchaeum sp.]